MWLGRFRFSFFEVCGSFLDEEKGKETKRVLERGEKKEGEIGTEKRARRTFNVWPAKRVKSDSRWKDCDSEEKE